MYDDTYAIAIYMYARVAYACRMSHCAINAFVALSYTVYTLGLRHAALHPGSSKLQLARQMDFDAGNTFVTDDPQPVAGFVAEVQRTNGGEEESRPVAAATDWLSNSP
jgi:hypothetical protein